MGTQSTAAEGRFELEEKYRCWKETYLPAGDTTAEKLLTHIKPIGNFRYAAGLTTSLLFKRGLNHEDTS